MPRKSAYSGVYAIVCLTNKRRYVGSAADVVLRYTVHRWHLRRGSHHSQHLQRAWNKYGEDQFEFVLLEQCAVSVLEAREQYHMDRTPAGMSMNTHPHARSARGYRHKEETKHQMLLSAKEVGKVPEEQARRSNRAKEMHRAGKLGWKARRRKALRSLLADL